MACAWSRVLPTHSTPRAARPSSQVTLIKRSTAYFLQISGSNEEINEAGKASIKSKSCYCSITEFWAAKGTFASFPINFLGRARRLRDVAKEFWIQAQPHQNLTSPGEKALQSGQNSGNIWPLGHTWHSTSGSFWQDDIFPVILQWFCYIVSQFTKGNPILGPLTGCEPSLTRQDYLPGSHLLYYFCIMHLLPWPEGAALLIFFILLAIRDVSLCNEVGETVFPLQTPNCLNIE